MIPLGLLGAGERAEVVDVMLAKGKGRRCGALAERARLEEMGLRQGGSVTVVSNEGTGPLLLKLGESRVALGRGVAMKVMVRQVAAEVLREG